MYPYAFPIAGWTFTGLYRRPNQLRSHVGAIGPVDVRGDEVILLGLIDTIGPREEAAYCSRKYARRAKGELRWMHLCDESDRPDDDFSEKIEEVLDEVPIGSPLDIPREIVHHELPITTELAGFPLMGPVDHLDQVPSHTGILVIYDDAVNTPVAVRTSDNLRSLASRVLGGAYREVTVYGEPAVAWWVTDHRGDMARWTKWLSEELRRGPTAPPRELIHRPCWDLRLKA